MQSSFLKQSCDALLASFEPNQLARVCILLPNRRSGFVMQQCLRQRLVNSLPTCFAIDDFVPWVQQKTYTGSITLLLQLYEVFQQIDPRVTLDKFSVWGYILLKDLDHIDRNLIDAHQLFSNLQDVKRLEQWGRRTEKVMQYFQLWDNLEKTYFEFKQKLVEKEQAYPGMLYRSLAENMGTLLLNHPQYDHFVAIGFNALSKAEETIFQQLVKKQKMTTFWDSDSYYFQDPTENKAGLFLEKYKKTWASEQWRFESDALATEAKDLQIIQVVNASQQGRVANHVLKTWMQETPELLSEQKTVVVLPDENLLISVLHAFDPLFEGLNITMGVSIRNSSTFNFINLVFDLKQETKNYKSEAGKWSVKFNYRHIIRLFSHPFLVYFEQSQIQAYIPQTAYLQALVQFINRHNLFYLSLEDILQVCHLPDFQEHTSPEQLAYYLQTAEAFVPIFELLFEKWGNTEQVVHFFEQMIAQLRPEPDTLEQGYFNEFQKIVADFKATYLQLKKTNKALYKEISIRSFKTFLYQAFRNETIELEGEKESALQIMGLLETRALDFDNVIVLSANENTLPKNKKYNSFIPLDIARGFGLPTYTEQDAVTSYHFYRLMQRAKRIALVHIAPSDTYGADEKSRFLLQVENDWVHRNPQIKLKNWIASFQQPQYKLPIELKIDKNPTILQKIQQQLSQGIAPAVLNTFVSCSIKYYFSQIAQLKDTRKANEDLGADKFGTLLHQILEDIFRRQAEKNGQVGIENLRQELEIVEDTVIENLKKNEYANYTITGENYITKEVAIAFVKRFLEAQIQEIETEGSPFEIIVLENQESTENERPFKPQLSVTMPYTTPQGDILSVRVVGIMDRIDKIGGKIRIIDYKTGAMEPKFIQMKDPAEPQFTTDPDADKIRQLWIYKYILAKQLAEKGTLHFGKHTLSQEEKLCSGIYALRHTEEKLMELNTDQVIGQNHTEQEALQAFIQLSETYLSQIITNLLDPSQPFEKTSQVDICQYCAYKDICLR